ncbi:hypothetical protein DL98DRAFT_648504 [Cadophora sp. DSE1049]|nr:hypothetical protein DL98DRAFT_648504 [Cadophora sp. DSE1049]
MGSSTRPTQAAPSPPRMAPNQMSLFDKREQLIKLRLESLERGRKVLHPHKKWPTVKGVRAYKAEQAKLAAHAPTASPPPTLVPATVLPLQATGAAITGDAVPTSGSSSSGTQENTQNSSSSVVVSKPRPEPFFPFPVTAWKQLASFPQFGLLPTEIRLQIWEIAWSNPLFIEAQFCSDFYQPTYVNPPCHNALSLVCRESAEVLSKRQLYKLHKITEGIKVVRVSQYSHPHLTFYQRQQAIQRGESSEDWPLPTLYYVPSHDTIFLRSLDLFNSNSLARYSPPYIGYSPLRRIQHLALPFDPDVLSQLTHWVPQLGLIHDLKSLTLMVGSKEKSWFAGGGVELRPLHQWFADGRTKWIGSGGERAVVLLFEELTKWLSNPNDKSLDLDGPLVPAANGKYSGTISVRIVAWKKN